MKGGVRNPGKYFVKHEISEAQKIENSRQSSKLDVVQAKSVKPQSKSNKSQTAEEKAEELFEGEETGETKKIERVKSGGDLKTGSNPEDDSQSVEPGESQDEG